MYCTLFYADKSNHIESWPVDAEPEEDNAISLQALLDDGLRDARLISWSWNEHFAKWNF